MILEPTPLQDAVIVAVEEIADERGFFARTWCRTEFVEHGLNPAIAQCNVSFNTRRGTLRGMHYQIPPHAEAKLVRCTRGSVYDVILDLRNDSPTCLRHFGIVLSAERRNALYVPEGFAHGFLTLEDATEVFYQISALHDPASARGVRWNDPAFGIRWPMEVTVISDRDRSFPDFAGAGWT
jgi:dTDP-4-dehydrorhamnose 3,5-epimerase